MSGPNIFGHIVFGVGIAIIMFASHVIGDIPTSAVTTGEWMLVASGGVIATLGIATIALDKI